MKDHRIHNTQDLNDDLPGEAVFFIDILPPQEMYFDAAAKHDSAGARVLFVSLEKHVLTYSFVLTQLRSNDVAEYEELILGFQMGIKIGIKDLDIYGDSQLAIEQLLEEYEIKKDDLVSYHKYVIARL